MAQRKPPRKEGCETPSPGRSLDAVYAPGAEGLFDIGTIVIEGDDLRLVYSISGDVIQNAAYVFPPARIRVGEYEGITTLRTPRYNDPLSDSRFATATGYANLAELFQPSPILDGGWIAQRFGLH